MVLKIADIGIGLETKGAPKIEFDISGDLLGLKASARAKDGDKSGKRIGITDW